MAETVADDQEIAAAGFVESHCPAFAQTVTGQSLRVVADHAERSFDDLFRHRTGDRFRSTVDGVEPAAEEWFARGEGVLSGALAEVAPKCTVQFRADRHTARVATFAFEEAGWESDVGADLAMVQNVADFECEDFGDPEAEKHLRGDQGAIARIQAADMPEEDSLFAFGEGTRAGETSAIAEVILSHGANRANGYSEPGVVVRLPGFARALAQAVTPSHGAKRRKGGGEALPWRVC